MSEDRAIASVLYICDKNAVRSPMAQAITKAFAGKSLYVDSVGLEAGEIDHFVLAVLQEWDLSLERHSSKTLKEVNCASFDLVVALTLAAHRNAHPLVSGHACSLVYWPVPDPTLITGHRNMRLQAYRELRDDLYARVRATLTQGSDHHDPNTHDFDR